MKISKVFTVLLLSSVIFTILFGCKADAQAPNVAIVWGYHKNAPKPAVWARQVEDAIHLVATGYGTIAIVVNDGNPFVTTDLENTSPDNPRNEEAIKKQFSSADSKAKTQEVNTLAAINLAARCLADDEGEKQLYILDSGLSTTGDLNFRDGWLQQGSEAALAYLRKNQALPNLANVDKVVWIGLGDVGGEQETLSAIDRKALEQIWNHVLTEAGAKDVDFAQSPPSGLPEDYDDLPDVTPINVEAAPPPTTEPPVTTPFIDPVQVFFDGEEATFLDEGKARQELLPTAEILRAYPQCKIVLVGMTATDEKSKDCGRGLSHRRINAVRDLLLELGVAESQIAGVRGLGYESDRHIQDVVEGELKEELAAKNRVVLVLDATSAEAQEILNKY